MNINGTSGSENLTGTSGNDTITGFAGNDTLQGGSGLDVYVFDSGSGHDDGLFQFEAETGQRVAAACGHGGTP